MAITVFDGVAKFSADSSQLDQFIVQLEQGLTSASQKAAASTRDLKAAQDEFRAAIKAVSAEGGDTVENMSRLSDAEKNLALAAAAARQEHAALRGELTATKEETGIAAEAVGELSGELVNMFGLIAAAEGFKSLVEGTQQSVLNLDLLSQKTGIAITSLAGLEHVSEAAGVNFDQVGQALTRLQRAQVLAIEGGQQQVQAFQRIGISASELKSLSPDQLFYRVADAMANSSSHAEAAASAFALLGRGGAALIPIFQQGGEELKKQIDEAGRASGVNQDAAESARNWQVQLANLSETFRADLIPIMEATLPVIRLVEELGSDTALVIRDLASVIGGLAITAVDSATGLGKVLDDVFHQRWGQIAADAKATSAQIGDDLSGIGSQFKENYQKDVDSIKQIWTDAKPLKPFDDDLSNLETKQKDVTSVVKAELQEQLAKIEAWKAGMHAAYVAGEIDAAEWAAAQVQAAKAADIANEDFFDKLASAYKKNGEAQKAQGAQLQLEALQTKDAAKDVEALAAAEEKHRDAIVKVTADWTKYVDAGVTKEWQDNTKAAQELAKAENELVVAQTKLAQSQVADAFKDQEKAIQDLASFGLITEEQKAARLEIIYQQEADAQIKAIEGAQQKIAIETASSNPLFSKTQLADLQKNLAAAEGDYDKSIAVIKAAYAQVIQGNPFITDAQVAQVQTELAKVEAAWTKSQNDIEKAQEQFNAQQLASTNKMYAEDLSLAISFGNKLLAEKLKENHASLLTVEAELAEAKARGVNTAAIQAQVKELQAIEKELDKEAQRYKTSNGALNLFIQSLQKGNQYSKIFAADLNSDSGAMSEFGAVATAVSGTFGQAWQSAFQAAILGEASFGAALAKATADVFANIAAQAAIYAIFYTAQGIADIFWAPPRAAADFAAAAEFAAVAGAAGAAAYGLNQAAGGSGTKTSSSSGGTSAPAAGSPPTTSAPQPVQTVNIQSYATGGFFETPTLAIVGDSQSGFSQAEAVIPLENDRALDAIASALVPALQRAWKGQGATSNLVPASTLAAAAVVDRGAYSPASTHDAQIQESLDRLVRISGEIGNQSRQMSETPITIKLQSDIPMVARKLSKAVNSGRARLLSSNSIRVTRRS